MHSGRHITAALCLTIVILFSLYNALGTGRTRLFLDGINDYNTGKYKDAVKKLSHIAEKGVVNGKLYYNLGNAYLKSGDVGRAILWYERALKLMPHDPDLRFNINYARSKSGE